MAKGTFSPASRVIGLVSGYANAAVLDEQVLTETPMPCDGRLGGVQVSAGTAGSGSGNTVVDVQIDGTSVYAATTDRPTLAATSTGEFSSGRPANRALRVGNVVKLIVKEVSTTGHAALRACVAIERP